MDIKAVAFDLDGTLYPDKYVYIRSIPLFIRYPRVVYFFNKMRKAVRKLDKIENFRQTQGSILAGYMGVSSDRALQLMDSVIYDKWKKYFSRIRLFPFVRETLVALKRNGYKLALLSDYPIETKLSILGIESIWDYSVSSETLNYLKPHPEPFNHIQRKLGLPAESILYVGDRYKYDIIGAKKAGMKAAHFTKKKIDASIADITFSDYRDLYAWITKK
jgi:putative hydrolase of the HAD superfamily